jgi:hypothetical protein
MSWLESVRKSAKRAISLVRTARKAAEWVTWVLRSAEEALAVFMRWLGPEGGPATA